MSEEFLNEKYPDLAGSYPVQHAVRSLRRAGEKVGGDKQSQLSVYMDRLEHITDDDTGFSLLKQKMLDEFTFDADDREMMNRVAQDIFQSESQQAILQGRGAEIQRLGARPDVIKLYEPVIRDKAQNQKRTLTVWLDYLRQNDAKQPTWFRYYVVRNLTRMGTLNKETNTFSTRSNSTLAPFPEMNPEALSLVYRALTDENYGTDDATLMRLKLAKNFPQLYAHAMVKVHAEIKRDTVDGEWRKFPMGSDPGELEKSLTGKGTGWCTATGSAKLHLDGGDFYVFYTKNSNGAYTEPRLAIRMENGHVSEVRGVNKFQEIEPELLQTAEAKYHELPGGYLFDKKAADMKRVTDLAEKQAKGIPFTSDELVFIYEIDGTIQGFGYEKDIRIEKILSNRNQEKDLPVIFKCKPYQIAKNDRQIRKDTVAFIGRLTPGIFHKLPDKIRYVYTEFPGNKIPLDTIDPRDVHTDTVIQKLHTEPILVESTYLPDSIIEGFLSQQPIDPVTLVTLTVHDLGYNAADIRPTYEQIMERARTLGLTACPDWVGSVLRTMDMKQILFDSIYIAGIPFSVSSSLYENDTIMRLRSTRDGLWLGVAQIKIGKYFKQSEKFVFIRG